MGQTLANHSYVDISEVGRPDVGGGLVVKVFSVSLTRARLVLAGPIIYQLRYGGREREGVLTI